MAKPAATALVLLLLAVGAAVAVVALRPESGGMAWNNDTGSVQAATRAKLSAALTLDPARVDRVQLDGPEALVLERSGDQWRLGAPHDWPASAGAASAFLAAIARLEVEPKTAPAGLARHGPILRLRQSDGRSFALQAGPAAGAGLAWLWADDQAYLVNDPLHRLLARPPAATDLAAGRLPLPPPAQVRRLELRLPERTDTLERGADGRFQRKPAGRASQVRVGALLSFLAETEVTHLSAAAPDWQPLASLVLRDAAGAETRVDIGPAPSRARADGTVVPRRLLRLVRPGHPAWSGEIDGAFIVPDLRDPALVTGDPADLEALSLDGPTGALELQRRGQNFVLAEDPVALDPAASAACLQAAFGAEAIGFGPLPVGDPVLWADLRFGDRDQDQSLEIHQGPKEGQLWVVRAGDPEARLVSAAALAPWFTGRPGLLERRLAWPPRGTQVAAVELRQPGFGVALRFVPDATEGWKQADGAAFDAAALRRLLGQLSNLRAGGYRAEAGPHAATVAEVVLEGADGARHLLRLGADDRLDGPELFAPGIPLAGAELRAALLAEFRPHRLLALPPERIARIELAAGTRKRDLARGADGALPAVPGLAPAAIAALWESAGQWQADQPAAPPTGAAEVELTLTDDAGRRRTLRVHGQTAVVDGRAFPLPAALGQALKPLCN